jgi:hypothetical protein
MNSNQVNQVSNPLLKYKGSGKPNRICYVVAASQRDFNNWLAQQRFDLATAKRHKYLCSPKRIYNDRASWETHDLIFIRNWKENPVVKCIDFLDERFPGWARGKF